MRRDWTGVNHFCGVVVAMILTLWVAERTNCHPKVPISASVVLPSPYGDVFSWVIGYSVLGCTQS